MKKYTIGDVTFTLERTSSGRYKLKTEWGGNTFWNMFSTKEKAMEEILSYAEE